MTHKRFKIELMNCFLNEMTKNLYETKNIVYQPQAQACGFFVCLKKVGFKIQAIYLKVVSE